MRGLLSRRKEKRAARGGGLAESRHRRKKVLKFPARRRKRTAVSLVKNAPHRRSLRNKGDTPVSH